MGPFWRVSVNRDDPQARLPPVEAILFLPRALRMHTQCVREHEKHGRKCAARVQLVCWLCVGILSFAGFTSIDRYRKKGQLSSNPTVLSHRLATLWLARSLLRVASIPTYLIRANTT